MSELTSLTPVSVDLIKKVLPLIQEEDEKRRKKYKKEAIERYLRDEWVLIWKWPFFKKPALEEAEKMVNHYGELRKKKEIHVFDYKYRYANWADSTGAANFYKKMNTLSLLSKDGTVYLNQDDAIGLNSYLE